MATKIDISDSSVYTNMSNRVTAGLQELTSIQNQISSGNQINDFEALAAQGDSVRLLSLQTDIAKNQSYLEANQSAATIAEFIDTNLETLISIASSVQANLTTMQSSSGKSMQFTGLAENYLQNIQSLLNSTFENNYIFGGTITNTAPVGDIVNNSNIIDGQVSNNYYKGGSVSISVVSADSYTISFSPLADDQSFQNLIAALHTGISADKADSNIGINQTKVAEALTYISDSISQMIELRSILGNNMSSINSNIKVQTNLSTYYNQLDTNIAQANLPLLEVAYNEYVTMLQATFMLNASAMQVSILDYLK